MSVYSTLIHVKQVRSGYVRLGQIKSG